MECTCQKGNKQNGRLLSRLIKHRQTGTRQAAWSTVLGCFLFLSQKYPENTTEWNMPSTHMHILFMLIMHSFNYVCCFTFMGEGAHLVQGGSKQQLNLVLWDLRFGRGGQFGVTVLS